MFKQIRMCLIYNVNEGFSGGPCLVLVNSHLLFTDRLDGFAYYLRKAP